MADFNVRSDSINVEHIMEQIRARIREKRGVDYTEAQIQELASARLEKYIDPDKLRSNLLQEFHRVRAEGDSQDALAEVIDESVLFETHRPWLRGLRSLLRPILKLFLNTKALAALAARSKAELARRSRDQLTFEIVHNMVVEMTRLAIEVKNLTMRVESMQSRLEFNERRSRALESVVVYKPSEPETIAQPQAPPRPPVQEFRRPPAEFRPRHDVPPQPASGNQPSPGGPSPAPGAPGAPEGTGQRSRRRRRRRGRRGGAGLPPGQQGPQSQQDQQGQPSPQSSQPGQAQYDQPSGQPASDPMPDDGPDEGGGDTDSDPDPQ